MFRLATTDQIKKKIDLIFDNVIYSHKLNICIYKRYIYKHVILVVCYIFITQIYIVVIKNYIATM